jgi:hypothetical protein
MITATHAESPAPTGVEPVIVGLTGSLKKRSRYVPREYRDDPVGWTRNKRGAYVWSKQGDVLESVRDNRFTAVHSMHGTGKSWTAADLVAWWIDAHPPGQAFAVTTAPTAAQVEAILWREIGQAHTEMGLEGNIAHGGYPKWMLNREICAYGRKPTDYADNSKAMQAFQGIHAKYVLVVLDEACGIPRWLWDAVDTLVTNEYSRVLAIGNPDDPASHFAKICQDPRQGWNTIHIGKEHLPWATGEADEPDFPDYLNAVLTGPTWVEERKKRWGEASPLYVSKVLGHFPEVSDDTLISPKWVREARERELAGLSPGHYGGDIARMGADETVVYRNRDGVIREVYRAGKQDTTKTIGAFAGILTPHQGRVSMTIDSGGMGVGVYDQLRAQGQPVYPFDGGGAPRDKERFGNRRAEAYWEFKEAIEDENGLIDLDMLDDDLASQLMSIKWKRDLRGRIFLESKEDMKKRGMPSPDRADACVMSHEEPMGVLEDDDIPYDPGITGDLMTRNF